MKKIIVLILLIITNLILTTSPVLAGQKHWRNPRNLKTYIQPGYGRSELIKKAFRNWSIATKDKVIFYYVSSPDQAQIRVYFGDKIKRTNNPQVAGLTRMKYLGDEMIEAEVLIPTQTAGGLNLKPEIVYVSMLHEIGHALGIQNHSTNPQNLMYPSASGNKKITQYDLAELYRIYGWKRDF